MKTIQAPDMMCENCVKRISEAFGKAGMQFRVSLPEKTVEVDGDTAAACALLEDLGFTPKA